MNLLNLINNKQSTQVKEEATSLPPNYDITFSNVDKISVDCHWCDKRFSFKDFVMKHDGTCKKNPKKAPKKK